MKNAIAVVLLAACGSEPEVPGYAGLEPGLAAGELRLQVVESNASAAPFVVGATVVTGDPAGELEVVFGDGERSLTFTLTGPFSDGQIFSEFARYRESDTLQWISAPPELLRGGLSIEIADPHGFTFSLAHIMTPGTAEATEEIIFDGSGDVAFPR